MNKKILIVLLFFITFFTIPFFYQTSFSKYMFEDSFIATKIQIHKKPQIEVIGISNTNTGYEKYANNTHRISLRVKIIEKHVAINHFADDMISIFVDDLAIHPTIKLYLISNDNGEMIYDIMLSRLTGNGTLSIVFPEGIIEDSFGLKNDFQKFDTGVTIDNISPTSSCEELTIENNQSQYIIHSNENIRPLDGWDFYNGNSSLSKMFPSPVAYPITITDYAGNVSDVFVSIQHATNMMLYYVNDNGYPISEFNHSGQISGNQAILDSSSKKTERVIAYLDSDMNHSILQGRVFDYTYWGENTSAICIASEIKYFHGYSPSPTTWYDIYGLNAIHFFGKLALQLGGRGHNDTGYSCINQVNPLPEEIAKQNLYGLSGIAFQLKNCEEYSIVYQIYVASVGWLRASSDGEETTYAHDKPFSAIRMSIVPKSEKQHLINYWNRVIYTNYTD